jgi:hypothetical protein
MKFLVKDLDNKDVYIKLSTESNYNMSLLQKKAHNILLEIFPNCSIYTEVGVPIRKGKNIRFDFFILQYSLFIEVQGEQHEKFTSFFHKDKGSFLMAQNRDDEKKEWCLLNNYKIIELKYNEVELWKNQILSSM